MANALQLQSNVAAALRAEMAVQKKSVTEMAAFLQLDRKATKLRYDGTKALSLIEVDQLAAWLDVAVEDLLLANRAKAVA
jgi:DNA-binding Xre family transcriptional regulator